jgi:DNA adenine methylase
MVTKTLVEGHALQSPITYYGGKKLMLRHILPLIPQHTIYVEPFAGGLAVYFAKPISALEIVNDLNGFVVNFWQQLKSNYDALHALIEQTLHSRRSHHDAYVMYENPTLFTDLQKAWAFWVLCNMGRSGQISDTWGNSSQNDKVSKAIDNKRNRFTDELSARLSKTQIESIDAVELIKLKDSEQTFFYIDPPYVGSDMGHYKGYTQTHFEDLLNTLQNIKGKFLLSSYRNAYLTKLVKDLGWYQIEIEMNLASSTKKGAKKIEVLTSNYCLQNA